MRLVHVPEQLARSLVHHEQTYATTAESNARLTRRPCAVDVAIGSGRTSTSTGASEAWTDSVPLLVSALGTYVAHRSFSFRRAGEHGTDQPVPTQSEASA